MLWPFKEKETKEMIVQLTRLRETLSAAVVVDSRKSLINLTTTAKEIDRNVIVALQRALVVEATVEGAASDTSYVRKALDASMEEEERDAIGRSLYPDGVDTKFSYLAAL